MTTNQAVAPIYQPLAALKYALTPVHGHDIAVATVALMLDGVDGAGGRARVLHPGEPVPFGAQPVLVAPSTVYATVLIENLLRQWPAHVPKPWLVLVADVPAAPAPAARYRLRALSARLAGIALVPYLPVLRTVEGPGDAIQDADVIRAAAKLCRRLEGKNA
ncbi:hypothetical protein [Streptacidiphilus carbonis]|uniref:hypothetical protein n=1 Tax=Streptacidiphilus carbonis TaxID=105422 RepID=UPI00126A2E2F|nr:hypothetical protein [Streptacidiphilus carbonis]